MLFGNIGKNRCFLVNCMIISKAWIIIISANAYIALVLCQTLLKHFTYYFQIIIKAHFNPSNSPMRLFLSSFYREIGTERSSNLPKFIQLSKTQSSDLSPDSLGPEIMLFITVLYCHQVRTEIVIKNISNIAYYVLKQIHILKLTN